MSDVWVFDDPRMDRHDPGPRHPDSPTRSRAMRQALQGPEFSFHSPTTVERSVLELFHDAAYLDRLETLIGRNSRFGPTLPLVPGSVTAALSSAACAVSAMEAVCKGETTSAIALTRPAGHHAEASRPLGYCMLNNPVVAALHAVENLGIERLMVIDWDAFHGNGIQNASYHRRDICLVDFHLYPAFPGTGILSERGVDAGLGTTFNIPIPKDADDAMWISAMGELLPKVATVYRPDVILVVAGFSAHQRDNHIGHMKLTSGGFAQMMQICKAQADQWCNGRMVVTVEGGFHTTSLTESLSACGKVMAGTWNSDIPQCAPDPRLWKDVSPVLAYHAATM